MDIGLVLALVEEAVQPFPKAALFELADEGYRSVFQQLVACLISVRTRDELTLPSARALFAEAPTLAAAARMTPGTIDECIFGCAFHMTKALQIHAIATAAVAQGQDDLPCDFDALTALPGIGPKCAGLALGIACGEPHIGVDSHVHRITNRWGYIATRSPEDTLAALREILPQDYWLPINRLLVPFGKHICTPTRPFCSRCPVRAMCQQRDVRDPR